MRHPGLQHEMRMKEIASAITRYSGTIQGNFNEHRRLEAQAAKLKAESDAAQKQLDQLLKLQSELISASRLTEFGLPSGMTNQHFEEMTGRQITS